MHAYDIAVWMQISNLINILHNYDFIVMQWRLTVVVDSRFCVNILHWHLQISYNYTTVQYTSTLWWWLCVVFGVQRLHCSEQYTLLQKVLLQLQMVVDVELQHVRLPQFCPIIMRTSICHMYTYVSSQQCRTLICTSPKTQINLNCMRSWSWIW